MKKRLLVYLLVFIILCVLVHIVLSVDAKVYDCNVSEVETEIEMQTNKDIGIERNTVSDSKEVSLGEFKLTAYCSCEVCCGIWAYNRPNGIVYGSIGEELKEGYSIAVDPNVIPYRSEVIINGHTYKAQDCGGAIKGNRIDVYFDDHQEALNFGVQYTEVFMKM